MRIPSARSHLLPSMKQEGPSAGTERPKRSCYPTLHDGRKNLVSTVTPPIGDDTDDQGRKDVTVVRATYAVTISGVSVIVLLTILSGCGEIGVTAVGAIAA